MTNCLTAMNIQKGQFITVTKNEGSDRSFLGDVMKVKAIDLPFIIVDCFANHGVDRMTLDTRSHEFMELSDEYAEQFAPTEKKNEVTLKLTDGIQAEVEHILKTTDLQSVGNIFKHGFTFLVQYMNAELNGYEIHIVDNVNQPTPMYRETIELPFRIKG